MTPVVTVFMAVFNGSKFIEAAIKSVLNQSFADFELLIIDDGSEDDSVRIVKSFSDPRIRLLCNPHNVGLFKTRNIGINEARGKYFATLDCDDISTTDRLKEQIAFLEANPDYAVCGGRGDVIDIQDAYIGNMDVPVGKHEFLRSILLFSNVFINSSTTMRLNILRQFMYRDQYEPAEDYDLFERIATSYRIFNLNKKFVWYRSHGNNISKVKSIAKASAELEILRRQLGYLEIVPTDEELRIHHKLIVGGKMEKLELKQLGQWLKELLRINKIKKIYRRQDFGEAIFVQKIKIIQQNKNPMAFKLLLNSSCKYIFVSSHLWKLLGSSIRYKLNRGKRIIH